MPNGRGRSIYSRMATTGNESTSLRRKARADEVHKIVRQRIREYPYLAVATGAGVAWVLAGGLAAHKTRRVLGTIGSLAMFSPILTRLIGMGAAVLNPSKE